MKKTILFLLGIIWFSFTKADSANTLWQLANHAYQNKNYEAATNLYDSLIRIGYTNSELFLNAGNAHFKNHEMGMAVWCYEKAHQTNQTDDDVNTNLKISNLRLVDKDVEALPQFFLFRWWNNFLHLFSAKVWSIIAIIFLWMMLAGWLLNYFSAMNRLGMTMVSIGFIAGVFFFYIAWRSNATMEDKKFAVVIPSNITVKSAPDNTSTDLFIVHEGLKVQTMEQLNGWQKIILTNGKKGWTLVENVKGI